MGKEKIRDYNGPPLPEHLMFENQALYYFLTYTIYPLAGMNTNNVISNVLRNAIYAISEKYIFDVENMFLCILMDSAQHPKCLKLYGPWIQKVIMQWAQNTWQNAVTKASFLQCVILCELWKIFFEKSA